jgi:hypothetical protein
MRKVKEVLRLRYDLQLSYSQIRRSCGISNGSLNGLLTRAAKLGLTGWAQVRELSEEALEKALFRRADDGQWLEQRPLPDWAEVERELRRHKHLTLKLVWGEYLQANPGGTASVNSASCSAAGAAARGAAPPCARITAPATRCRSTTPATPLSSWTTARCGRRRSSSPACRSPG